MKKVLFFVALAFAPAVFAKPVLLKQNYSGIYECKGSNELVGDYDVKVILKLKRYSEVDSLGTYDYSTETANAVTYRGQAITFGNRMAMTYKLSDSRSAEFSTGLTELKKTAQGKWSFKNHYYESDDTGGNYGTETCLQVASMAPAAKKPKKPANSK